MQHFSLALTLAVLLSLLISFAYTVTLNLIACMHCDKMQRFFGGQIILEDTLFYSNIKMCSLNESKSVRRVVRVCVFRV